MGLFPEGTTSVGFDLLPFHASLFEPARSAAVEIQPVALCFLQHGQRSGYAAFVGEESLVANLWRVLGVTGLAVEVVFLPPLPARHPDGTLPTRLELSHQARDGNPERTANAGDTGVRRPPERIAPLLPGALAPARRFTFPTQTTA